MTKSADSYKQASTQRGEGRKRSKVTFTKIIQELFPTLL